MVFSLSILWWRKIRGSWKLLIGETDWGGNWVFFWWVGPCSSNLEFNFLLMGGAVFPPWYFPGAKTMLEVMKIMVTSFKRSHACTATLTAPKPAAGQHRPPPLLETPGHSWASLGQSLVGSLVLSPGKGCMGQSPEEAGQWVLRTLLWSRTGQA